MGVRVLIVDDHAIVRLGLKQLLRTEGDIAIVGEAGSVQEGLRRATELKPDVVLMDINLPDASGIEGTRLIKEACPTTQILILTVFDDQETVLGAIEAGAVGYVLKDIPPEYLAGAIRSVHANRTIINPAVARRIVERLAATARQPGAPVRRLYLTNGESEVLREVAEGLSDPEIARKLFLSVSAIKGRLRSIYRKLHVRNRAQAAAYAERHGPRSALLRAPPATGSRP